MIAAWLFVRGVFRTLAAMTVPLLLALAALALTGTYLSMKWAGEAHDRRVAERSLATRTTERDLARSDLSACQTTRKNLDTALNQQNALVEQLGEERDAAVARGNAAIRKANELNRKYRGKIADLQKARPGPDQCESARNLIIQNLSEDR